jgi:hypothetical protein
MLVNYEFKLFAVSRTCCTVLLTIGAVRSALITLDLRQLWVMIPGLLKRVYAFTLRLTQTPQPLLRGTPTMVQSAELLGRCVRIDQLLTADWEND